MMGRILVLLAATAVTMVLVVGGSFYGWSSAKIAEVRQDSATTVANAVALTLSQQINLLNRTLAKMAQDPEVLIAVTRADPVLLTTVAARLEKYFPDALKIRLLLPGVSELDETTVPRMGFADLDMVRETFTNEQSPGIQGYEGADRHLAMTVRVVQDERVVGVILASLNYDFFSKSLQAAAVKNGVVELRQGNLVLGASGLASGGQDASVQATVAGTNWRIYHHYAVGMDLADMVLIISIMVVPIMLLILGFIFGHRRFLGLLAQDLDTVLSASKDLMTHTLLGSYPVNFSEVTAIIAAMMQFKRTFDHNSNEVGVRGIGDLDLDGLGHFDLNKQVDEDVQGQDLAVDDRGDTIPALLENKFDIIIDSEIAPIFRAYDICGIMDETLTCERVHDIGRAFGTAALAHGCKIIVIGWDGRLSSPALADVLAQGIISVGLNVLSIGRVPMPMLQFVVHHSECRSGVMITAGHNPANYNGLKMIIDGKMLVGEKIQQLSQCISNQSYASGTIGVIDYNDAYTHEYIGTIAEDIHIARPMLVVLDCGNGVAGDLGPNLLQALGCEIVELYCDVDGSFPNHLPDPGKAENLAELIASVKHYKADLGIAFDGDGDRLGVVDSNGNIIWPDRQMMLFAKDILANRPGAEIIFDVKCTRHLAEQITKYGGKPIMWKTGRSFIKAKLKETGAVLAGEMSGHISFNDRWFGFADAMYSAARLIEILSKDARSSAEIFDQFPGSLNVSEWTIALQEGEKLTFMESLLAKANFSDGKITTIDGLRVDFENGWGLVRASNTMPALVVRFEADTHEALLAISQRFRRLMEAVDSNRVLPF